jgi:hypothetical protein
MPIDSEKLGEFVSRLKDFKDDIFSKEKSDIIDEFKEMSLDKLRKVFENLSNASDLLNEAGYQLVSIDTQMGLPPGISLSLAYEKAVSDGERKKILEKAKENKALELVLHCLFKADDFYTALEIGNFSFTNVTIKLGLIPDITLKFSKK